MDTTDIATVTVFKTQPRKSVIVRGYLEHVPETDHEQAAEAIAANAYILLSRSPDTTSNEAAMTFYRLNPEEYSGRAFGQFTNPP